MTEHVRVLIPEGSKIKQTWHIINRKNSLEV